MNSALFSLVEEINSDLQNLECFDPMQIMSSKLDQQDLAVRKLIESFLQKTQCDSMGRILDEYFGFGPIKPLIEDESVSEILINGTNHIFFEKAGKIEAFPDCFLSPLTFRNFIERLGRLTNTQANLDSPFVDGYFEDFRVHIAIPPGTQKEVSVCIRRHPKCPWTLKLLEKASWATASAISVIQKTVQTRCNFIVVGPTGSGKTSVLNACLGELPNNERAVIIEDASELKVPNAISTKILTRNDPQKLLRDIDQAELLKQALRMRPDRIVMGEIRGSEAKDLLMAFATGHSGCMGTMHADSARQALLRLEMLIQLGASQWSLNAVRTLILLSLSHVIVVKRSSSGLRQLDSIHKITSLEENGFLLEQII